ncbi:MAG: XdhC family protein [Gemmatimonadaceae bacterium]
MASGGGAGALASVARRRGSLPMSASAKMLVTASGARLGTVGGGCLEAEITERALAAMERREPAVSEHTLNSELAGDYGLTCGGTAVMFIEPVFVDETLGMVYAECAAVLARGEQGVMATCCDWSSGVEKVLVSGGRIVGSTRPFLRSAALAADPLFELPRLEDSLFIDPIIGAPRLVVFGGGHVGASVAEAAAFAGWRVTVVDDRSEYADSSRLPFCERAVVSDYHDIPATLAIDASTYIVVATRGHQHDAVVVEQLARLETRYLGMIGSRRKVALTWRILEAAGVPPECLERVHAPMGISIGADSPEEIAVSVVAEMIAERRTGSRRRGGISSAASAGGRRANAVDKLQP